jgi:hypothetical protein
VTAPSDLVLRRPGTRATQERGPGRRRTASSRPAHTSKARPPDAPASQPHHPGRRAGGRLRRRRQATQPGPLRPPPLAGQRRRPPRGPGRRRRPPTRPSRRAGHLVARGRPRPRPGPQHCRHEPPGSLPQSPLRHPRRRARPPGASIKPIGWSATTVPDTTAAAYAGPLEDLAAALVLWRRQEHRLGPGGRSRNLLAATCGCGGRIRVAKTTLAQAPILCSLCSHPFQPDDQDN